MALSRAALALLMLVACDPIEVGAPREPEPAPGEVRPMEVAPDESLPCAQRTRLRCLRSSMCTLAAPESRGASRYECRDAHGNCEVALRQIVEDRDRCDDRDGCHWSDASCYCPCRGIGQTAVPDGPEAEQCDCECSGGPPPGCRPD